MKTARTQLIELYLDYRNNYLTIAKFAEHNGITKDQAHSLIILALEIFEYPEE